MVALVKNTYVYTSPPQQQIHQRSCFFISPQKQYIKRLTFIFSINPPNQMDFHSLARKELQALCKLNKIPANMNNIAMADALKSLEIVEGIEDFLNPSESVTVESSIDSPERNVVTSQKIPPTGRRTSTRRKPVGDESDSVQIMTKSTRPMPRRAISGEIMDEAKADIPKNPAVRSSKKTVLDAAVSRMEIQSKESEVSQTPVVEPNSRRKGAAVSSRRTNLKKEEVVDTV